MGTKLSKAQKIRFLYARGKTCNEIAEIVGCLPAYARVCAQQRIDGRYSTADTNYIKRRYGTFRAMYVEVTRKRAAYHVAYRQRKRLERQEASA